jgi:hypothetical protein
MDNLVYLSLKFSLNLKKGLACSFITTLDSIGIGSDSVALEVTYFSLDSSEQSSSDYQIEFVRLSQMLLI